MYKLKTASIDERDGRGYAFTRKTVFGKAYQGVFFAEDEASIEELKETEELTFTGTVYHRGKASEQTFPVEITNVISTRTGERADFVAVENP